ncbi:MAG: hypothetical protein GF411_08845 [Candidatus Lokiarchaeota archaeon]|nr:hypothetical protein [Candidatus Lokiarchaeota archaeon]
MFELKYHCNLNLFEQDLLTGEDRQMWINLLNEQRERENKESKSNSNDPPQLPATMPSKK